MKNRIHPLVKVGSALSALSLAACQVGNAVLPTTPEASATNTPTSAWQKNQVVLTPTFTEISTVIPTPDETATVTATATEISTTEANFTEFDKTELSINGNAVEFTIGKENGADVWGKWGIESLVVNKDAIDYQKKISTMISAALWQVFQYQSVSSISYEDFLKGAANYKINLVSSDGKGGFASEPFTLNQVKQVKVEYLASKDDPRLNFYKSGLTAQPEGFNFNNGILTLYRGVPESDNSLDDAITTTTYKSKQVRQYMAGHYLESNIYSLLENIAYSPQLGSPGGLGKDGSDEGIRVMKIRSMFSLSDTEINNALLNTSDEQQKKYFSENILWEAVMK